MKVQYFGDVNDYSEFALLRLLAKVGGFSIGVCWMLTAADGIGEGGKRGYLSKRTSGGRWTPSCSTRWG